MRGNNRASAAMLPCTNAEDHQMDMLMFRAASISDISTRASEVALDRVGPGTCAISMALVPDSMFKSVKKSANSFAVRN